MALQASTKISPLQLYRSRTLPNGMAESSHLATAFLTEPEKMESALAFAFGDGKESASVLNMMTGGLGNTRFVSNREYTWELHGQTERAIMVSRDSDGGATPGYGGLPFRVYFSERLFEVTDTILADDGTPLRIQEEPFPDGTDFAYTVVIADPSVAFIDPTMVGGDARFSKEWSSVEEYSIKGGGVNFEAPTRLVNQLTTLRKHFRVTRSAATDYLVMEVSTLDGKKTNYWTKLLEWTAMRQWYQEIEKNLIYSVYSKNAIREEVIQGQNKRPIFSGAGMRQQISPANIRYYTKLTYEILESFLIDLSYAATKYGTDVKFVALTGKMGMVEFNNAIVERQRFLGIVITDSGTFITGKGTELTLQGQFKTVKFLNGLELTVREFPPYDNLTRNRTLHPISQKPIESYRFTLLNFGTVSNSGKNNIRKVAKKDSENAMWYVAGSVDPMGNVAKSMSVMRSSGIDGYEVHFLAEIGLQMQDPTSCGELIMDLNY
jgi:hypothetical protein